MPITKTSWTKELAEKYGSSQKLISFIPCCWLERSRKKSVIFPLYFYSIKDFAKSKFVNFSRRHAKANGAQSVFWYEQWLKRRIGRCVTTLIDYTKRGWCKGDGVFCIFVVYSKFSVRMGKSWLRLLHKKTALIYPLMFIFRPKFAYIDYRFADITSNKRWRNPQTCNKKVIYTLTISETIV